MLRILTLSFVLLALVVLSQEGAAKDASEERSPFATVSFDAAAHDFSGLYVRDHPLNFEGTLIHVQEEGYASGRYEGTFVTLSDAEQRLTSATPGDTAISISPGQGRKKLRADKYGPAMKFPQFQFSGYVVQHLPKVLEANCDIGLRRVQPLGLTGMGENIVHSFKAHTRVAEVNPGSCMETMFQPHQSHNLSVHGYHRVGVVQSVMFVSAVPPFNKIEVVGPGEAFRIKVQYRAETGRGDPIPKEGYVFLGQGVYRDRLGGFGVKRRVGGTAHFSKAFRIGGSLPVGQVFEDEIRLELNEALGVSRTIQAYAGRVEAEIFLDGGERARTTLKVEVSRSGAPSCTNPYCATAYIINSGREPISDIHIEMSHPNADRITMAIMNAIPDGCETSRENQCAPSACSAQPVTPLAKEFRCPTLVTLDAGERKAVTVAGDIERLAVGVPDDGTCRGGEYELHAKGKSLANTDVVSAKVRLCIWSETMGPEIRLTEIYTPEIVTDGKVDVGTFSIRTEYNQGVSGEPTLSLTAGEKKLGIDLEKGRNPDRTSYFSGPVKVQFVLGEPFDVYVPPSYQSGGVVDTKNRGVGSGSFKPDPLRSGAVFRGELPITSVDNAPIELALANLPPHGALQMEFDLKIVGAWIGSNPWSLRESGNGFEYKTTFSNVPSESGTLTHQAYPGSLPAAAKKNPAYSSAKKLSDLAGNLKKSSGKYAARIYQGNPVRYYDKDLGEYVSGGDLWEDAIATYQMKISMAHHASTANFIFGSEFKTSYAGKYGGRRWAIENLRVKATPAPPKEVRYYDQKSGRRLSQDDILDMLVVEARFDIAVPNDRTVNLNLQSRGGSIPVVLSNAGRDRKIFRSDLITIYPGNVFAGD